MPVYEFSCGSCGERFEELVGSHVGVTPAQVRCPACGAGDPERRPTSSYAAIHRRQTPGQRRRREDERGVDRGGAKERFKRRRAAARRRRAGRG